MVTFVSWNLGKQISTEYIVRVATYRKVDCFLVAGNASLLGSILDALGRGWECLSEYSGRPETAVIARQGVVSLEGPVISALNQRLQILPLSSRHGEPMLLAHAYLRDPCSFPTETMLREARAAERAMTIANCLRDAEETTGIRRTILAGDLRVDPHHSSVVGVLGLNATEPYELTVQPKIRNESGSRRRFVNPMANRVGKREGEPVGTDFILCSPNGPSWHIYNQVLLRPELSHSLREIEILANDGRELLVTPDGLPDCSRGIHHLPVLWRLQW